MAKFHGILVVDKPLGMTSRAAVNRVLGWFPRRTKIGHTGTLDPLATGVLVLCIDNATRLAEYVQDMPKVYRAGLTLGARSDTDDREGVVTPADNPAIPGREAIDQALQSFIGKIEQVPPIYSAARIDRKHAYDLAREGKTVALAARPVRIDRIDVLDYQYPNLTVEVECGKGTYIRSLARDLGEKLGCGGLLDSLRRERVGTFSPAEAVSLEAYRPIARTFILPVERALDCMPRIVRNAVDIDILRHGQAVPGEDPGQEKCSLFNEEGALVGVVAWRRDKFFPVKML